MKVRFGFMILPCISFVEGDPRDISEGDNMVEDEMLTIILLSYGGPSATIAVKIGLKKKKTNKQKTKQTRKNQKNLHNIQLQHKINFSSLIIQAIKV